MTAEALALREGPLGGERLDVHGPAPRIVDEPFRTLVDVRGADVAPVVDGAHTWQLGPRWWLVDAPDAGVVALESPLAASLRAEHPGCSVVDVSSLRTVFVLTGADARAVLAHGCSLDLDPRVVPVGGCVQGMLAQTQVSIGRTDEDALRVHVRASFARHLAAWLRDAAVEYL
ncbi:sarcosine oxidase subunit gamma [Solicola sp. PLA-1-18]|uniref:sarcosine oxidase subunit gamma n=1 Tax=Solicola sp. PLA-1-18 TaxID=3380532 RepID=UPI003B78590A